MRFLEVLAGLVSNLFTIGASLEHAGPAIDVAERLLELSDVSLVHRSNVGVHRDDTN